MHVSKFFLKSCTFPRDFLLNPPLLFYKGSFCCKDNANERNENLFSNCRVQLILCKDNANECNENLFSNCRVQLILCKDKTFSEILKIFQNKYIEIRKMLDCNLLSKN